MKFKMVKRLFSLEVYLDWRLLMLVLSGHFLGMC